MSGTEGRFDRCQSRSRMVFVGGLQRSGTTLVGSLLASNSAATGLIETPTPEDEGQFVQDVYLTDHQLGTVRGRVRGAPTRWAYNPAGHLTEADLPRCADARRRLDDAWSAYWGDPEAEFRVEKSPSNLIRTRFLQAAYPGSAFVIVTRHPVVQALAVRKWGTLPTKLGWGLDRVVDHWLTAMDIFREDQAHLEHVTLVAYEELATRPAQTLASAQAACGMPVEELDVSTVSGSNATYAQHWDWLGGRRSAAEFRSATPHNRARNNLYRLLEHGISGALGRREADRIRRIYGDRIAAYGYDVDDLDRYVGRPL